MPGESELKKDIESAVSKAAESAELLEPHVKKAKETGNWLPLITLIIGAVIGFVAGKLI